MGTSIVARTTPPSDEATLRHAYDGMLAQAKVEFGSDPYSGRLNRKSGDGLEVRRDKVFATVQDAIDVISDEASKLGPAIAVRFVIERLPEDAAMTALSKELGELSREAADLPKAMVARAKAVKSATRGCRACGSSIAVAWIGKSQNRDHFGRVPTCCPVCGDAGFLRTKADEERTARLSAAIASKEAAIVARRATLSRDLVLNASKDGYSWVIVAACGG